MRDHGVLRVVEVGGWQELADADDDHHATDETEENGVEGVREGVGEDGPSQKGRDELGRAGEQGPQECVDAVSGGVVDWEGDAETLWDVVDGDGECEDGADRWIVQRGNECGQSLWEIVQTDGECRIDAHSDETLLPLERLSAVSSIGFVVSCVFVRDYRCWFLRWRWRWRFIVIVVPVIVVAVCILGLQFLAHFLYLFKIANWIIAAAWSAYCGIAVGWLIG
mmetsp:Transcript_16172/g.44805  ORF Transcript_16172/g.44805 Transcript_16172/m.44805 type:complete len:223 (-) Transcript_16172:156-824(-)